MYTQERVFDLLVTMFVHDKAHHFSYCRYPDQPCTCRDITTITPDTLLISDGYIDSMGVISLVVSLEREFDITIENRDIVLGNFETVNKITNLIDSYTDGSAGRS